MSLIAALLLAGAVPDAAVVPSCGYDPAILDLGIDAFDQDMNGGWRTIGDQPGCETRAADMIRAYREKYEGLRPLLYWHEGQMRALAGDSVGAVALMHKARDMENAAPAWPPYVDATIAFLRRDRPAFDAAQRRLAAVPKPAAWPAGAQWPMNGDVVEGLERCFDRPYRAAMAADCRPPSK